MSCAFVQVSSLIQSIKDHHRLHRVQTGHTRLLKVLEDNMATACTANESKNASQLAYLIAQSRPVAAEAA